MALKLGDASTAKYEYEEALASSGLSETVARSVTSKLEEASQLLEKQVLDAVKKEAEQAAQRFASLEKLHVFGFEQAATLDIAALKAAIATAEACGVVAVEVDKAHHKLCQAIEAQEVEQRKQEKAALEVLRLVSAPEIAAISPVALQSALDECRACGVPEDQVEAGQVRLAQVVRWQKAEVALSVALSFATYEQCDVVALRLAVDEAKAIGLPRSAEAAAILEKAEESAKERVFRHKMQREAEKNLNAAMPSMFGKADPGRLSQAIEIAKKAGVGMSTVAAAEQKLASMRDAEKKAQEKARAEEEMRLKGEAEKVALEERMKPILEQARKEAEEKAKAEAEARAVEMARKMAEERVHIEAEAQGRAAAEQEAKRLQVVKAQLEAVQSARRLAEEAARAEAEAIRRQDAANELRLAAGSTLAMLDIPRLMKAVEVADELGVELAQIASAQHTLAEAQRRATAEGELAAALLPSVEELTNQDAALIRLRAAAAEAEQVGLPSLSAAQQKVTAVEKMVAQRDELTKREASRRETEAKVRREAEEQLRASMPGFLKAADPAKLQAAIEAAKATGVATATVAVAEAKLLDIVAKERGAGGNQRLSAQALAELTRREANERQRINEEALKTAMTARGFGMGSIDADKLDTAIATARAVGVSEDKLAEAETRLARIRQEKAAADEAAKYATFDKELKEAAGISGFFGTSEITDVSRLEAAVLSARAAGVTTEVLGKAEAKLAAIRIDTEKKRSFERPEQLRKLERELELPPPEEDDAPPEPPSRRAAPPVPMPRRAIGGRAGGFKAIMGIESKPLPFAPSAPGMMEKLTQGRAEDVVSNPTKMGFSSIRGAGSGVPGGGSGPKKIKAQSAPLKFAPGVPSTANKGPVRMIRRNTDSENT